MGLNRIWHLGCLLLTHGADPRGTETHLRKQAGIPEVGKQLRHRTSTNAAAAEGSKEQRKVARAAQGGKRLKQLKAAKAANADQRQAQRKAAKAAEGSRRQRKAAKAKRHAEGQQENAAKKTGQSFFLATPITHERNTGDNHLDLVVFNIVSWRPAPPPSRYIDVKISAEGEGCGAYFPVPARSCRRNEVKELYKDTFSKPNGVGT